jgi:hypothetical protein
MSNRAKSARPVTLAPIYQMTIVLEEVQPPIWRRFQVASDVTLYRFHQVLQTLMGWTSSHLYLFEINGVEYEDQAINPDPLPEGTLKVRRVRLNQAVTREKTKLLYVYDFGDDWRHHLLVESILPPQPGMKHPVCLGGQRACPPEDCGGPFGYQDLLKILKQKRHPEYASMKEWVGPLFEPERFDLDEVNAALRRRPLSLLD